MKLRSFWIQFALASGLTVAAPLSHATNVGVAISIGQPGVQGYVQLGSFGQPALVSAQPVIVQPVPMMVAPPPPLYLWVPVGHRRHWNRYCGQYNACGRPVYFVQDGWYQHHVVPTLPRGPHGPMAGPHAVVVPAPGPQPEWRGHDRGPDWDHDRGHGHDHHDGYRDH